jgi:hypothetical protein
MAQTAYRESFRKSKRGLQLCYIVRSRSDDAPTSSNIRASRTARSSALDASGLSIVRIRGLPDLRFCRTRHPDELSLSDAAHEQLRHESAAS